MIIYTDGACSGNGTDKSKGGYAVVICNDYGQILHTYRHFEEYTTNNRQELKAILFSLIYYGKKEYNCPIVYSDSAYCVNTLNEWMWGWQKKGWLKSNNRPPENLDLIQTYYDLCQAGFKIDLRKISGHSGNLYNELADALATGNKKKEDEMRARISQEVESLYGTL